MDTTDFGERLVHRPMLDTSRRDTNRREADAAVQGGAGPASPPSLQTVRVGVVGLGYVGLPLAVAFGRRYDTVGFDINARRVTELREGRDSTLEVEPADLAAGPTPALQQRSGHVAALQRLHRHRADAHRRGQAPGPAARWSRASEALGRVLKRGDVVVYESTVYPGCTEEVCVPILERDSGLKFNHDFFAGYSPERINPGDKEHRLTTILKVTSGSTPEAADFVDALYGVDHHRRHAQGQLDQGRRSGEGDREHPARPQHRADQRAGDHLQQARHRHAGSAAGGRHQVELPAVPAGPGRRPLHRRGSLLPDPQGAGDRLPPGRDPRRPPHQRRHGRPTSPARSCG